MASTAAHTRVPILARRLERVGARFIARPARSVAARVKRGTWNVPDDEVPSDERVGGGGDAVALDLDAEEPEPDPIPPALGSFAPGRDDGMARMPVPDIALESPGRWSPISFAFLGDAVWELYVRRAFFAPPARPLDYDLKCKRAVRAEAQDVVLRHLIERGFFTEKETGVVRWGRNASYGNVPTRLRGKGKGGHAIYRNASALECVVGWLYMTDLARLEEMMAGLGRDEVLERVAAMGDGKAKGKGK